ncbi:hypothetical protein D7D52_02975 [Nocardia yunnanensis]|uniref:Uncharacterized protein n=1 Tax=Nocardia yunnanensis TaxID=2382165 RepID=A0A386Z6X2_9NOCA|nr:hypothetical protein [Nocardia yunnanensis]AYF73003.1 hypothetical protein D7D52_02975 [Nocardia yunnanensis]
MIDEPADAADSPEPAESHESPRSAESRAGRPRLTPAERARLARVFGDELPSTTKDERTPEPDSGGSADDWLRSQVPPHHG